MLLFCSSVVHDGLLSCIEGRSFHWLYIGWLFDDPMLLMLEKRDIGGLADVLRWWVADAAGSEEISVWRDAVADRRTVDCHCATDVGGWTGRMMVAARGVAAAVVGLLDHLVDTGTGGWADGGLAGTRAAVATGGWLVSWVVDAADGAALVVRGAVAADDGGCAKHSNTH